MTHFRFPDAPEPVNRSGINAHTVNLDMANVLSAHAHRDLVEPVKRHCAVTGELVHILWPEATIISARWAAHVIAVLLMFDDSSDGDRFSAAPDRSWMSACAGQIEAIWLNERPRFSHPAHFALQDCRPGAQVPVELTRHLAQSIARWATANQGEWNGSELKLGPNMSARAAAHWGSVLVDMTIAVMSERPDRDLRTGDFATIAAAINDVVHYGLDHNNQAPSVLVDQEAHSSRGKAAGQVLGAANGLIGQWGKHWQSGSGVSAILADLPRRYHRWSNESRRYTP